MGPFDWHQGSEQAPQPSSGPGSSQVENEDQHEIRDIYKFKDKSVYEGEWDKINNVIDGRGIKIWVDGTRYDGCWF